jgi:hypothetical protein
MIGLVLIAFFPLISSISIDIRYPQFFHQSLFDSAIEITEGKTSGSFIAFVNLINYTNLNLNEWILNTTDVDFQIQSNGIAYSLVTTQLLDRERKNFYHFSIDAQHLVPPFEKISKEIRFRILDINDCTPTFNQTFYQAILTPNHPTFTIQAFDCDEPNSENSRISYSLSNYQDLFRINESTGVIECIKGLNSDDRYEIIVVAFDHGKPSLSSTTLVQIQLISSKPQKHKSSSWFQIEQRPENMLILAGILVACFLFIFLLICLICGIKYKLKRRHEGKMNERKFPSTSSINSSNEFAQPTIYDAVNIFPNTYYLPVQHQSEYPENSTLQIPQSSSTTSSPISATDLPMKIGSDDGCYCSSDMSSEQSNNILLLNPSSLTSNAKLSSKHVRFNHIDGVLQRFENLYESQAITDHCASYV